MSMTFTIDIRGTVRLTGVDASDLRIDAEDLFSENTNGDLSVQSASIESATVDIEADVILSGREVEVADLTDFDPEQAIEECITSYDASISGADFDIVDSPTGFEVVESATDRETAIEVYAALNGAGLEVS